MVFSGTPVNFGSSFRVIFQQSRKAKWDDVENLKQRTHDSVILQRTLSGLAAREYCVLRVKASEPASFAALNREPPNARRQVDGGCARFAHPVKKNRHVLHGKRAAGGSMRMCFSAVSTEVKITSSPT